MAPAERSTSAQRKAESRLLDDGESAHSLATLVADLATLVRTTYRTPGAGSGHKAARLGAAARRWRPAVREQGVDAVGRMAYCEKAPPNCGSLVPRPHEYPNRIGVELLDGWACTSFDTHCQRIDFSWKLLRLGARAQILRKMACSIVCGNQERAMTKLKKWSAVAGMLAMAGASQSAPVTLSYTGAIVTYTIAASGVYDITALGAQGGSSGNFTGGLGAEVEGTLTLSAGDILTILVGGQGTGTGGGGGTFIALGSSPLLVAGGGGAASHFANYFSSDGGNGLAGAAGSNGGTYGGQPFPAPIFGGAGGAGGSGGGSAGGYCGGGGGGFSGDGVGVPGCVGKSFLNGGAGGDGGNFQVPGVGGFGGGGGGYLFGVAGGGGGYSGGGGGMAGGGGGSYLASSVTQVLDVGGFRSGNGDVVIDAPNSPPGVQLVPEPTSLSLAALGLTGLLVSLRRRPY